MKWAGSAGTRKERRILSSGELKSMSDDGLVEIGSHGENHVVLAAQSADAQWREISRSKRDLEEAVGRQIQSFSYPYGAMGDVGKEAILLAKQAGYSVACSTHPGPVRPRSDRFWLPRLLVRDWDGDEFARRLRNAFTDD